MKRAFFGVLAACALIGAFLLPLSTPARAQGGMSCVTRSYTWGTGSTDTTGWSVASETDFPPSSIVGDSNAHYVFSPDGWSVGGGGYTSTHTPVGGTLLFSSPCPISTISIAASFNPAGDVRVYTKKGGVWGSTPYYYTSTLNTSPFTVEVNEDIEGFTVIIYSIYGHNMQGLTYNGLTATSTPTNTPPPTNTPTPIDVGAPYPAGYCIAPSSGKSDFSSLTGWSLAGGSGNPVGYSQYLALPPGSQAITEISGLPNAKPLQIYAKYRASTPAAGDTFTIQFGASAPVTVNVENDTSPHSYTGSYQVYPANFGTSNPFWSLKLARPSTAPDTGLRIELICLRTNTAAGAPSIPGKGTSNPAPTGSCEVCSYQPTGDIGGDIGKILGWVGCVWRSFWCQLGLLLTFLLELLLSILGLIGRVLQWVIAFLGAVIMWIIGVWVKIVQYAGGWLSNIVTGIVSFLGGIASGLVQLFELFVNFIVQAILIAVGLVKLLFEIIGALIQKLFALLGLLPQLIAAIVNGFNSGAAATPTWAPVCSDPTNFMYWPCLGLYVADNTIWDGPAFWLIPGVMLIVGWSTITWAIAEIKGAFSQ